MIARCFLKFFSGVMCGVFIMCVVPASVAVCETIYKWRNDIGEVFYSNISPPGGIGEFDVIIADNGSMGGRSSGRGLTEKNNNAGPPSPPIFSSFPDETKVRLLAERIKSRKKEIIAMEQLLGKQVNHEGLRKSLLRKKRYLAEDLICLAELNP